MNVVEIVHSHYWWRGRLESADESLFLIKTRADLFRKLEHVTKIVHPYEVPEIIALPITRGSQRYLDWISAEANPRLAKPRRR